METKHHTCQSCKQVHCRKDLCSTEFTIRLEGLEDGLTYRIYELQWKEVEIELINGNKIQGTLNFVGFSFVEIVTGGSTEERANEKGQSSIISVKDIERIEVVSS